jgi:hypothetical protein
MYKVLFSFLKVSALRLASNSPLAILLQQFSFSNSFPFKKPPTKCQKPKSKSPKTKSWGPLSMSLLDPVVNRVELRF